MKSGLLSIIIFLLISESTLLSQTNVTGNVTDSLNNPVPFASIYLANTSIGTYADIIGNYSLIIPQEGTYELIVSSIGFKLYTLTIYAEGKKQNIDVKLRGNIFNLNEVTVKAKGKDRRKNYSQFIKTFIGETLNSKTCKIINPEDLILHRDTENNRLTGYSRKPLKIENKSLGYVLLYDLLDYSYDFKTDFVKYSGYCHFEPTESSPGRFETIMRRRLAAYYGSQMHFLRALFSDSLSKESFRIYECKFDSVKKTFLLTKQLQESNLILKDNNDFKTLMHNGPLLVRYVHNHPEVLPEELSPDKSFKYSPNVLRIFSNSDPASELAPVQQKEYNSVITISDTLKLYRNGYYYKPYSLTWAGEMAQERIAEKLPSDFLPNKNLPNNPKVIINKWDSLTQGFKKVESKHFAEKAYLHIDRNLYYAGEDIWFKAYVIDPSTNLLSDKTNNLHVELIAADAKIMQSRTFRVSGGLGNGDLKLSDSVSSGKYLIRTYTNHMRNYDNPLFFMKEITIINPYDDMKGLDQPVQKIVNKIDISFFPEGGSLVDNVTSTVAFKAVNSLGKSCDVSVELYSSSGQLITTLKSTHLGMGSFNINPIPGYSYYAIVKSRDGLETRVELPKSIPIGVVVHTYFNPDKELILSVNTNIETLPLIQGKDLSLHLSCRNLINQTAKIRIDSVINNFIIPIDSLPSGILRLTLSTESGLPLCERLLFFENDTEVQLNVITEKTEYRPREKVTLGLLLSCDTALTREGYISIASVEEGHTDYASLFPTSIASWFLLESDVRGPVEEPSFYFDQSNKNRLQDLDLLLLTQGWRDFQWKYDTLNSFRNERGFTISGNVRRMLSTKLDDIKVNLGLFSDTSTAFFDTKTDITGSFRFEELDITGDAGAFVSSTGKYERIKGKISIDSIRYDTPAAKMLVADTRELIKTPAIYNSYQQDAIIKLDNRKKYKLSDTLNIGEVFISATRTETPQEIKVRESRQVYGKPDKEVVVTAAQENYTGDVFSYISGRIPGVRVVRGIDSKSPNYPNDVRVIVRGQSQGAIILLNGLYMDQNDLTPILTLPMQMVDRVDVLNASPLYGMAGANGVVNIITRTGIRRTPFEQTVNTASFKVHGFEVPRIYYSPKYDSSTSQTFLPDNRKTIYWTPDITLRSNMLKTINYFNADNSSKIIIIVEGITDDGIPITEKTEYYVK